MTARDEKEKAKSRRDTEGKFFFGLSTATYTVVVLGSFTTLIGVADLGKHSIIGFFAGSLVSIIFAMLGHRILKK